MQRYIFIVIIFICCPFFTQAQFCTGTLGDNIFLEGDFGEGIPNLLAPNPNIAPGYNYTFNVPPLDGQYVVTNNTAAWAGLFQSWLAIRDNSDNPNGYMMVVNASNSPGLFYEQTVTGLCENTLYEFSADIINLIRIGVANHIKPNVSFLLNGVELFSTGDIPETDSWNTYGFTFTTQVGQQSLTLSLRNNAPGGIGNDLALDNIFFRACGPETQITSASGGGAVIHLCEGDAPVNLEAILMGNQYVNPAFQWQQSSDEGATWEDIAGATTAFYTTPTLTAGLYHYRFLVADGINNLASQKCRVNSDPKIIRVGANDSMQNDITLCEGQSVIVGNSSYTTTGLYRDTFTNFFGCDSILITNLTVKTDSIFFFDLIVTPPCPSQTNGSISIQNLTGGTTPFNFNFEGMDLGTTTLFQDLQGGTNYTIVIEDANGCMVETNSFIAQPFDFMADLLVTPPCPNQANGSIMVENVSGGTAPYNFIFEGIGVGGTTIFSGLTGDINYTVVIEDENGCSFERSAFVEEPEDFMLDLVVNPPCPNQTNGIISIENVSGGTPPYNFTFEEMNVGATTVFTDLPGDITYTVLVEDSNGCTFEESAFMEQPGSLIFELGENKTVELGERVQISPFYNFTPSEFIWQILSPLDCIVFEDCEELNFVPTSSEQITLELFASPGCSLIDSLFIEVLEVRKVYIPNAFSPNADGLNDFFTVFGNIPNVEIVEELKVFNRWGAIVFENENFLPGDHQTGWDGTFQEKPVPVGVYVYSAAVRFVDGEVIRYSGDVSVVK